MSAELTLTPRDLEIVQKVFQCFKSPDALKIDTDKLAQLAGFSNGRSANASWCVIKKKLMGLDGDAAAANADKATATNGDTTASPIKAVKATPKRGRVAKAKTPGEGEADDETTPSPRKAVRKPKAAAASEVKAEAKDVNGEATNEGPPTKKRRAPTKAKDPNATPNKRAKKNAKGDAAVTAPAPDGTKEDAAEDSAAANSQLDGNLASPTTSIFGDGGAKVKTEEQIDEDEPFDEEEQKIADEGLAEVAGILNLDSQTVA